MCSKITLYILLIFNFNSTIATAFPIAIDEIAVIINDNIILKSDIDSILDLIKMENIYSDINQQKLIEEIILKIILFEIGKKENISLMQDNIYKTMMLHIKSMADRRHLPIYQFYNNFIKDKWKYHVLYEQILQNIINSAVIRNNIKNYVTITPYEISQRLKNQNNLITSDLYYKKPKIFITEMHVRHIFLLSSDKEIQEKLTQIYQEIKKRKIDFSTAAHKYSQDLTSVFQGGDLGWITPDMLDERLGLVLLNLNKNEISPPIFSENGWHLIQLQETRKKNKTDVLLKERLWRILYQLKWNVEFQQWITKQYKDAYVKILDTNNKY
ncbi:MAG: peptidylprolyl isomerase [Candidatus Dasytiphilus stammeri]